MQIGKSWNFVKPFCQMTILFCLFICFWQNVVLRPWRFEGVAERSHLHIIRCMRTQLYFIWELSWPFGGLQHAFVHMKVQILNIVISHRRERGKPVRGPSLHQLSDVANTTSVLPSPIRSISPPLLPFSLPPSLLPMGSEMKGHAE